VYQVGYLQKITRHCIYELIYINCKPS